MNNDDIIDHFQSIMSNALSVPKNILFGEEISKESFNTVDDIIMSNSNIQSNTTDRNIEILKFNERLYSLLNDEYEYYGKIQSLDFLRIVLSNIEEFISIRFPNINNTQFSSIVNIINNQLIEIGILFNTFFIDYGKKCIVEYPKNNIKIDEKTYHLFINDKSYIVKLIPNKSFTMPYTGKTLIEAISDIKSTVFIKKIDKYDSAIVYSNDRDTYTDEEIYNELINSFNIHLSSLFHANIMLKEINEVYKEVSDNTNNNSFIKRYYKKLTLKDIRNSDIIVNTPYDSYQMVLDFIENICTNDSMNMIFITLYRVSTDSKIINSLIKAAKKGIKVFVYVEVTARGDEDQNFHIINKLSKYENINVSYNYFFYKIHSKLCIGINYDGEIYSHIGTGNYNERTAKIYTDMHLLTADYQIGYRLFTLMRKIMLKEVHNWNYQIDDVINISPLTLKPFIINKINNTNINDRVVLKCNHFTDKDIIESCINAANRGIVIDLCIRTTLPFNHKPHKNINMISKIGEFLEHDRVYIFESNGIYEVYISSADLLPRNLNDRIELLVKIKNQYNIDKIVESVYRDIDESSNRSKFSIIDIFKDE